MLVELVLMYTNILVYTIQGDTKDFTLPQQVINLKVIKKRRNIYTRRAIFENRDRKYDDNIYELVNIYS